MNVSLSSAVSFKKDRDNVVIIILVCAGLFMTEHLIPAVTFHERKFHEVVFNDIGLLYSLRIAV